MFRTFSRNTTTSTGNTSGCPQLSRAQRGALDGLYQGATEPAVFERGDARDGRAAGRRDHVLELARVHARLEDQARGAEHGLRREQRGGGAVETHLDPAVGQRLDLHRDIGRSGAREPRDGVDAVALRDLLEMLRARIGGGDGAGGDEASLGQALDQRLAHVTRAEECHPLALDAHAPPSVTAALGARGPKIAVPTRTMVAPSSIATSKSPLIPMEQCSSPAASRSSRSRLKNIRAASAL